MSSSSWGEECRVECLVVIKWKYNSHAGGYRRTNVSITTDWVCRLVHHTPTFTFFLEPTRLILSECCGYWEFCCLFCLKYAWLMGNGSCLSTQIFSRQLTEFKKGICFLGTYWEQGQTARESRKLWISILDSCWIFMLPLIWHIQYDPHFIQRVFNDLDFLIICCKLGGIPGESQKYCAWHLLAECLHFPEMWDSRSNSWRNPEVLSCTCLLCQPPRHHSTLLHTKNTGTVGIVDSRVSMSQLTI